MTDFSVNSSLQPIVWDTSGDGTWTAHCKECETTGLCKHMQEFFRSRGELFHGPLPAMSRVIVPLFEEAYSKGPINVRASIGREDEYGNRPFALADPEGSEKDVIGVLSPQSGVWAIRNAILQWAYSLYIVVPPCDSNTHRKAWPFVRGGARQHDAKKPEILTDILHLVMHGTCFRCTTSRDSLVPDL